MICGFYHFTRIFIFDPLVKFNQKFYFAKIKVKYIALNTDLGLSIVSIFYKFHHIFNLSTTNSHSESYTVLFVCV